MEQSIDIFAPSFVRAGISNDGRDINLKLDESDAYNIVSNFPENLSRWEKKILQLTLYADRVFLPMVSLNNEYTRHNKLRALRASGEIRFIEFGGARSGILNSPEEAQYGPIGVHGEIGVVFEKHSKRLKEMADRLAPLVEEGIVAFYDPYDLYRTKVAERLFGTLRYPTDDELVDKDNSLFVAEGMLFADALGVPYTATTQAEISVFERILRSAEIPDSQYGPIMRFLVHMPLPGIEISPTELVKARLSEESFEDFRRQMRISQKLVRTDLGSPSHQKEIEQVCRDYLNEAVGNVTRQSERLSSFRKSAKSSLLTFSSGSIACAAVNPDPFLAILGGAISSASRIILEQLLKPTNPRGAAKFFNKVTFSR